MISLDFLKSVDLFKGLEEDQLIPLQQEGEEKQYLKGKKLFSEGDEATDLWILVDGQIDLCSELPGRVHPEIFTVSSVSPGEALGWSSFVPPYRYRLSAYCAKDICTVLRLGKDSLLRLFESDFRVGYRVMTNLAAVISKRFQQLQESATAAPYAQIKIKVHLATCGIAAGAREVMKALMEELPRSGREDIQVESAGCIGRCDTEPNVTVEIEGEEPVIYQKMDPEKMRRVFRRHILEGQVQSDLLLR
ncbi:MAG: cyclic nucleotide-binding domain-containing protein [Deltaproteobacteria bacterium]|nr:cyclic nucleotide-binding domain-containing protein [Deltaproteobacteria bacterium]MBW2017762.1 cyclic nucleotide-binding domain-containing protein [Deltaproteobacteria bacterium]